MRPPGTQRVAAERVASPTVTTIRSRSDFSCCSGGQHSPAAARGGDHRLARHAGAVPRAGRTGGPFAVDLALAAPGTDAGAGVWHRECVVSTGDMTLTSLGLD